MIKITDIARLAGVSPATVSNVLNGKKNVGEATRKQVLEICRQNNYQPNVIGKKLKEGNNRTVLFNFSDFDRNFYLKIIQGISDYVYSKGYDLVICTSKNSDRYMNRSMSCGCITLDPDVSDEMIIRKAGDGYPIIVLDRLLEGRNIKPILVNNYAPQKELMEGLLKKGLRRFAYCSGVESLDNSERLKAVNDALKEHGFSLRRDDCYTGDYRERSGSQAARLLMLTEHLPDALICANDEMAIGAIRTFREFGIRVPEDISVTGFDDTDMARFMGLTTVQIPNYERGYIAAQYLLECVEDEGNYEPFKITAKVRWRKTSI